jgi:hypothetical protein
MFTTFGLPLFMSFLSRLFGLGSPAAASVPEVVFGRYSDAYKPDEKVAAFDRSLELFESGDHLAAYRSFLDSIRDEALDNVQWQEKDGAIHFEFWQGSQKITGTADVEKVKAQSRVARADDLNVGFLRKLVTANFSLKFSRYALDDDNHIVILFETRSSDGSPLKLNFGLRELAIHADKQDDLLIDEFPMLQPATQRVYGDISIQEKEIKYRYLKAEIEKVLAELDAGKPDPNQFPGTFAYMLLALAFKLDYLVRPEGFMMDVLERIHGIYFAKDEKKAQVKVANIRKEYQQLLERNPEDFYKEMYRTKSTFGVNPAVNHANVAALIDGELPNMEWPLQQNHEQLAQAVPMYIAGFALFHYAPPLPDRAFLHLFFHIMEEGFFVELGFVRSYTDEKGLFNKRAILQEIKQIADKNKAEFPHLKPDTNRLDFASRPLFAKSYMLMIRELNLSRNE